MGSRLLRETFDRIIPPQNLQKHLEGFRVRNTLQFLRKQGILNSDQWDQLYPAHTSSVSSQHFNSTLLMVLLGIVCKLPPPAAGCEVPHHVAHASREADIARVRYFINIMLTHADKASISDDVFTDYWDNIREMLLRLSGDGYEDAMDKMENQKMDSSTQEHYKELLKQWKKNKDCIEEKMNELESAMKGSGNEGEFVSCDYC